MSSIKNEDAPAEHDPQTCPMRDENEEESGNLEGNASNLLPESQPENIWYWCNHGKSGPCNICSEAILKIEKPVASLSEITPSILEKLPYKNRPEFSYRLSCRMPIGQKQQEANGSQPSSSSSEERPGDLASTSSQEKDNVATTAKLINQKDDDSIGSQPAESGNKDVFEDVYRGLLKQVWFKIAEEELKMAKGDGADAASSNQTLKQTSAAQKGNDDITLNQVVESKAKCSGLVNVNNNLAGSEPIAKEKIVFDSSEGSNSSLELTKFRHTPSLVEANLRFAESKANRLRISESFKVQKTSNSPSTSESCMTRKESKNESVTNPPKISKEVLGSPVGSSKLDKTLTKGSSKLDKTPTKGSSKLDKTPTKGSSKLDKTPIKGSSKLDKTPIKGSSKLDKTPTKGSSKLDKTPTKGSSKLDKTPIKGSRKLDKTPTKGSSKLDKTPTKRPHTKNVDLFEEPEAMPAKVAKKMND